MSVCLFVRLPGLLMPSALRTPAHGPSYRCSVGGLQWSQPALASPSQPQLALAGLPGWLAETVASSQDGWVMPPSLKWARLSSCQMGQRGAKKGGRNHKPSFTFQHFFKAFEMITIYLHILSVLYWNRKTSWKVNNRFFYVSVSVNKLHFVTPYLEAIDMTLTFFCSYSLINPLSVSLPVKIKTKLSFSDRNFALKTFIIK